MPRWGLLGIALLLLAGCDQSPTAPPIAGVTPFSPPAIYAQWWTEVEHCAGLTGDRDDLVRSWWRAPNDDLFTTDGVTSAAAYRYPARQVVLDASFVLWETTVKHEMLHALLFQQGIYDHPARYFLERCHLLTASEVS